MKNVSLKIFLAAMITGFTFISAQQPKPKPKQQPVKTVVLPVNEIKKIAPVSTAVQMFEIETIYGKMIFKLYNETPLHRDNFIKLASNGFYDSLLFHRVIPMFMIQGGDPDSKYAKKDTLLGNGDLNYRIPEEINKNLIHKRGALAAARDDNPDKASSGCQFYIVQGKKYTPTELNNFRNGYNYKTKTRLLQTISNSDSVMAKIDDFKMRGDKEGLHSYMLGLQPKMEEIYKTQELNFSAIQTSAYSSIGGSPHLDGNYTVFGEMLAGFNVLDSIAVVKTDANNRPLVDVRMKVKIIK